MAAGYLPAFPTPVRHRSIGFEGVDSRPWPETFPSQWKESVNLCVERTVQQSGPPIVRFAVMMPSAARRLARFGVRRELSGKGEEMVGYFPIGLLFGNFTAAKTLKMAGDDGHGANGI